jgi:hypothetical protein
MKVIALDLFGTVFDLSGVDRREIVAYIDHISKPEWSLLELPKSWETLPAFPDACEGLFRLRKNFTVVTCSNAPLGFTTRLLKNAGLHFDAILPLEMFEVYKPQPGAYLAVSVTQGVLPSEILMVTGNERLGRNPHGDREYAAEYGLMSQLIRNPGCPQTLIELAEQLGC